TNHKFARPAEANGRTCPQHCYRTVWAGRSNRSIRIVLRRSDHDEWRLRTREIKDRNPSGSTVCGELAGEIRSSDNFVCHSGKKRFDMRVKIRARSPGAIDRGQGACVPWLLTKNAQPLFTDVDSDAGLQRNACDVGLCGRSGGFNRASRRLVKTADAG